MPGRQNRRTLIAGLVWTALSAFSASALAQAPLDLWPAHTITKIRNRSTLNLRTVPQAGYTEIFFDSEIGDAAWADSAPPYAVHTGNTIRIHGYLATPSSGGPYPAIVIGHGHGGSGNPDIARMVASLGYVALAIDGPGVGGSTGGPRDEIQAWASVEEVTNVPSPQVSFLYHYAYAGMRAITALDELSRRSGNPYRIDNTRFGVMGASMGGIFTYYVNGVDDRVKAAVAIAMSGDWRNLFSYPGNWLYHNMYYYTRDGLRSGTDDLNTISDVCRDPTARTFLDYFDPAAYAPTQHAPLLTILGTHDQYFALPAINTTYERIGSAGTDPSFTTRILLTPNGRHDVIGTDKTFTLFLSVLGSLNRWLKDSFGGGPLPPETPEVRMSAAGGWMTFRTKVTPGLAEIGKVELQWATQIDTTVPKACDFTTVKMLRLGGEYLAWVPIGAQPACGPAASPDNVLYFVNVRDTDGYTVSSKAYYKGQEMTFGAGFTPRIEHYYGDGYPVPPPPPTCPSVLP